MLRAVRAGNADALGQHLSVESLEVLGSQPRQGDLAQLRQDVDPNLTGVALEGLGTHRRLRHIIEPAGEELANGLFLIGRWEALIELAKHLTELPGRLFARPRAHPLPLALPIGVVGSLGHPPLPGVIVENTPLTLPASCCHGLPPAVLVRAAPADEAL